MASSASLLPHNEHKRLLGDSISGPRCSGNLSNVKHKKEQNAGDYYPAHGQSAGPVSFRYDSAGMNNKVELIVNSPGVKKQLSNKNKKEVANTAELNSKKVVSDAKARKCDVNDPAASCESTKVISNKIMNNSRRQCYIWKVKTDSPFVWQKTQRNVMEAHTEGSKRLNHNNSFSGSHLSPTSKLSSYRQDYASPVSKMVVNAELKGHKGFHHKAPVEESNWIHLHRLNRRYYQYLLQSNQVGVVDMGDSQNSRPKHYEIVCDNNCKSWRRLGRCRGNFFQRAPLEVLPCPYHYRNGYAEGRSTSFCQPVLCHCLHCLNSSSAAPAHVQQDIIRLSLTGQHGAKPCTAMHFPRMNHVAGRYSYAYVSAGPYLGWKLNKGHKSGQDVACGTKIVKWIPVGKKDLKVQGNTHSAGICVTNGHAESNLFPFFIPTGFHDSERSNLISDEKIASVENETSKSGSFQQGQKVESAKKDIGCVEKPSDAPEIIGSPVAIEALDAAYNLQQASQYIQLAMGHPLAEVETFLKCAAPAFTSSSFACERCFICFGNQPSNCFLHKHHIPNIPLGAVWKWYEKPGNYGLEVKAEDFCRVKCLLTEPVCFHAYFVPFLSAVQLFTYPYLSKSSGTNQRRPNIDMKDDRGVKSHSSSPRTMLSRDSMNAVAVDQLKVEDVKLAAKFCSPDEPVLSSKRLQCHGGNSFSPGSSSPRSNDKELVFEFFESEQPPLRKPLQMKIMELISNGTSNVRVYGDPTKLESLNLHDLHPASWFSVAWYPIYRIPEGNFRASFLTYHSISHLYGKCIQTNSLNKKVSLVVFPEIGLQSYNAEGECWFNPRIFASTNSDILRERLRTLEENALLLSRGCVVKDQEKVVNWHPDFEFFMSRKH